MSAYMSSFLSRMFWRPPDVKTVPQWIAWRARRNARKLTNRLPGRLRTWWLAIHPVAYPSACPGVTLSVHPNMGDIVSQSLVSTGTWEPVETEIMLRLVKPGMTLVDVGANLGYMTVLGSRQVGPSGRVIAFEPEPGNFALLTRNVTRNRCDNVEIHQMATGAKTGESLTMFLAGQNLGDHRTHADPDEPGRVRITVRSTTVDAIVAGRRVDFVKMDIQGGEGHALSGMRETIEQNEAMMVLLEFWPYGLRRAGTTPSLLLDTLLEAGFSLRLPATSLDQAGKGDLTSPTTRAEILAETADERFEQTVNILAVRGGAAS